MKTGDREQALRFAVVEWQKRHGVLNHDPLLGVVELFHVFLGSLDKEGRFPSEKVWQELWDSVELLSQRAKVLSKQIDELGSTIDASGKSKSSGGLAVPLGAVLFCTGLALGRWWG
jgi:hypothetical protein